MKKAEEYLEGIQTEEEHATGVGCFTWIVNTTKNEIISIIKQAQIDAIDETVKRCAEEANLLINNLSSTDKEYNDYYQCGDDEISVNRQSILLVADKLKK